MANYLRCKIRVYPTSGRLNLDDFSAQINQLKIENNIYETIDVYYPKNLKFGEIRFTAKRFPDMLDTIFKLKQNDLWIITANEGGSSDNLRFETKNKDLFWGFQEKAIYTFDEVRLIGDITEIENNIIDLFGFGIKYINKHELDNGIKIYLNCLYTGNGFFYNEEEGEIKIESFENEIFGNLLNHTGEFWDMLFHVDGIKFKENFYNPTQHRSPGINDFPYLKKIEFYDKKRLTNQLEWTVTGGMNYWKHSSDNGFWNCENSRFKSYELFKN